jgi:hypothetical protein
MDKENMVYIHMYTMEYYSDIKKNGIMSFAGKWMELKIIMLRVKPSSKILHGLTHL